jgi:hypothetical protein
MQSDFLRLPYRIFIPANRCTLRCAALSFAGNGIA